MGAQARRHIVCEWAHHNAGEALVILVENVKCVHIRNQIQVVEGAAENK